MKAILVSKRFHPGHVSHIEANYKLLKEYGFNVSFALHERYRTFSGSSFRGRKASATDYLQLRTGDLFIVWFPSLSVFFDMLLVRLLSSARVVYVYHEPYTSFASYRVAGFSRMKVYKVTAISILNKLLCGLSHKIILPSTRAFNALQEARFNPTRFAKINLLFFDEALPAQINQRRQYIAYIGTIAEDHAFEEFVNLILATSSNVNLLPYKFLIATRSKIPEKFSSLIEICLKSGRLVVHCDVPMTNDQINCFYAKSYVVWNAYKRSMQSGVLPKAYMFGTPVLMSFSNQSEYFVDSVHGVLLSDCYSVEEFEQAIARLQTSWSAMSRNCRSYYLQNFDYHALSSAYMNFVSETT